MGAASRRAHGAGAQVAGVGRDAQPAGRKSQSVNKEVVVSLETGIDGAKRHLAVDTLALPWAVLVTAANVSDPQAGCELVDRLHG